MYLMIGGPVKEGDEFSHSESDSAYKVKADPNMLVFELIRDFCGIIPPTESDMHRELSKQFTEPPYALKPQKYNRGAVVPAEIFPFLKTLKELGISSGDNLIAVIPKSKISICAEFNSMGKLDIKLGDRIFGKTPERVDIVIKNYTTQNEEFIANVEELVKQHSKRLSKDDANRKRYLEDIRRITVYRILSEMAEYNQTELKKIKDFFEVYLWMRVGERSKEMIESIKKKYESPPTKKDVQRPADAAHVGPVKWLADRGYLGPVKK